MAVNIFNGPRKPALDGRGGGLELPPFLQGRSPVARPSPFQTKPMITPGVSQPVSRFDSPMQRLTAGRQSQPFSSISKRVLNKPQLPTAFTAGAGATRSQPTKQPTTPVPGKPPAQSLFEFLKQDLEGERKRALGETRASAAARGVFHGSPLTTSEGDIETSFLRGLGQLQSGILQNQEQNELARLGLAGQFLGNPASFEQLSQAGGINPDIFQTIGGLFAPRPGPVAPSITPHKPLAGITKAR